MQNSEVVGTQTKAHKSEVVGTRAEVQGTVPMSDVNAIGRGDWFITGGSLRADGVRYRSVCKEYTGPPFSDNSAYVLTIRPGTYIGPVHKVFLQGSFVTIQVPSTHAGWHNRLVFVNVGSFGKIYARKVPNVELLAWLDRGWQNVFLDMYRRWPAHVNA